MAPNQYAIGVTKNKFALCDSEEEIDPHELLKKQEKEKEEKKKAKVLEKTAPKPKSGKPNASVSKPTNNSKQAPEIIGQKDAIRPRSFPSVKRNFTDRNQSGPKQDREDSVHGRYSGGSTDLRGDGSSGSDNGEKGKGERRGFSRVFVRGGGRGRGGFDNGRKREYDRRSGSDKTGIKPVDKRRSSGSFNWGQPGDEIFEVQVPQEEPKSPEGSQTAELSDKVKTPEPANVEEESDVVAKEEEKQSLTLDEWKALKNSRPKPNYNLRKPGEGEDLTRWKDMVVLAKKDTEGEDDDEELEYGEYPQRVGRMKRIEIDVRFYDRRGRGRGGRGAPRGAYHDDDDIKCHAFRPPAAPRVDDEADFPSLV